MTGPSSTELRSAIYYARALALEQSLGSDPPVAIVAGADFHPALIRETEADIEASRPRTLEWISFETAKRLEDDWLRYRDERMRQVASLDGMTIFGLPVIQEPARPDSVVRTRAGREYRIEIAEEVEAGTR
jgi:hypothetical protein